MDHTDRYPPYGIIRLSNGSFQANYWAPEANALAVLLANDRQIDLMKTPEGYWQGTWDAPEATFNYWLLHNQETKLPDPFSRSQPDGVHGASRWVDLRNFPWQDQAWKNPALETYIIYEIHTGTFSPAGTFQGIIERLAYLKDLGITAIELMPVNAFPGERNWGYDGVFPFAVQQSYGGPAGLQALVNACHQHGLAIVLDVVYNHFGPEGNYFSHLGPCFTDKYHTPWGGAVNFDDRWSDGIRGLVVHNVLQWLRDFHIDALRLDAVHAIKDFSPRHILQEVRVAVDQFIEKSGRTPYLIVENDLNDPKFINPLEPHNGFGMDAQWSDEFHHALRVSLGEKREGYYADFDGVADLAKAHRDAYVYDGQFSAHRARRFGAPADNSGCQFVVFSQNHDQVGNRMLGERLSHLVSRNLARVAAAIVLLSPYLPLLFMGEEFASPSPFQYFIHHGDKALVSAVRKGRQEEFAAYQGAEQAPDPQEMSTFLRSKIAWDALASMVHQSMLRWYQMLISLRKHHPVFRNCNRKNLHVLVEAPKDLMQIHRWNNGHSTVACINFSDRVHDVLLMPGDTAWQKLVDSADPVWGGPAAAPVSRSAGDFLTLQPESIVVYGSVL